MAEAYSAFQTAAAFGLRNAGQRGRRAPGHGQPHSDLNTFFLLIPLLIGINNGGAPIRPNAGFLRHGLAGRFLPRILGGSVRNDYSGFACSNGFAFNNGCACTARILDHSVCGWTMVDNN
jgi:hypothetical protein